MRPHADPIFTGGPWASSRDTVVNKQASMETMGKVLMLRMVDRVEAVRREPPWSSALTI